MATPSAPFFARVATSSHRRRAPRARDVVIVIGIFIGIGVPRCARITADRRPRGVVDDDDETDVDETDVDAITRIATDTADANARASAVRTHAAIHHPPPINPPPRARSSGRMRPSVLEGLGV